MIPAVRQRSIIGSLRSRGAMSVEELAATLRVSASTIRRDLSSMETEGVLRRTFGGAVTPDDRDEPLRIVQLSNADGKQAVARAAAPLVRDGMTVVFDIGTTALAVARELTASPALADRGLTVVTASLPVFHLFCEAGGVQLFLLGGGFRADYQCTSGHLTEAAVREIRAELAFLGCSGVSADGTVRDTTLDQVTVKRAIAATAAETVLLADAAKFPGQGPYGVLSVDRVHRLVTDHPDPAAVVPSLADSSTVVVPA